MCDACSSRRIAQSDPQVWWHGADQMFRDVDTQFAAGDAAELADTVKLIPQWIAGNRTTGQTGCPNVMAALSEYAQAALDHLNAPVDRHGAPQQPQAIDMTPQGIWARQRLAAAAGPGVVKA